VPNLATAILNRGRVSLQGASLSTVGTPPTLFYLQIDDRFVNHLTTLLRKRRHMGPLLPWTFEVFAQSRKKLEPIDRTHFAGFDFIGGNGGSTWSIVGGTNHTWLSINPTTGVLSGTPVNPSNVGAVQVQVRVTDTTDPTNRDTKTFSSEVVLPTSAPYIESFEGAKPAGWIFNWDWEWGLPSVGPAGCYDGSRCVGTVLDDDYEECWFDTNYRKRALESPVIDLSGLSTPALWFYHWYETYPGTDGGFVQISTDFGRSWNKINPEVGYPYMCYYDRGYEDCFSDDSAGWVKSVFDLSAFANERVIVQFAFAGEEYAYYPGWYIDSVGITERSAIP